MAGAIFRKSSLLLRKLAETLSEKLLCSERELVESLSEIVVLSEGISPRILSESWLRSSENLISSDMVLAPSFSEMVLLIVVVFARGILDSECGLVLSFARGV